MLAARTPAHAHARPRSSTAFRLPRSPSLPHRLLLLLLRPCLGVDYDAWPEQLRRQLAPLFAAAGLRFEVRNTAKNGGFEGNTQLMCAADNIGLADFAVAFFPYVKPLKQSVELFARQALLTVKGSVLALRCVCEGACVRVRRA